MTWARSRRSAPRDSRGPRERRLHRPSRPGSRGPRPRCGSGGRTAHARGVVGNRGRQRTGRHHVGDRGRKQRKRDLQLHPATRPVLATGWTRTPPTTPMSWRACSVPEPPTVSAPHSSPSAPPRSASGQCHTSPARPGRLRSAGLPARPARRGVRGFQCGRPRHPIRRCRSLRRQRSCSRPGPHPLHARLSPSPMTEFSSWLRENKPSGMGVWAEAVESGERAAWARAYGGPGGRWVFRG